MTSQSESVPAEERGSTPSDRPVVWLVAAKFGAGSEVWMYRQARGMDRVQLRVVTLRHDRPELFPADGFDVTSLGFNPTPWKNVLACQAQMAMNSLVNLACGGFRGSRAEAKAVADLVERDRPRVALCHYGTWAVRMAPLLDRLGVPVVAHFNGHDLSASLRGAVYRRALTRWAPRFAACVVVADYMRDWLVAHGCDRSRIHKIPYGSPIADLSVANRVDEQPCRFLMVGRLTSKKRPDLSLRAFAACRRTCPDASLTVIGDGPLMESCRSLADELGLGDSVSWLGSQTAPQVRHALANASAFVQHSVTAESGDKEGWPVAIGEAAGSGLPVIATRHASIPEQVDDTLTGLLCDEGDWEAMGRNMATLASQPALRAQMGKAARAKLSEIDTANQVSELQSLLLSVAG